MNRINTKIVTKIVAKLSGSEGTDVARKFTDIRILLGLYNMNVFHWVLWTATIHKVLFEFLVQDSVPFSHVM